MSNALAIAAVTAVLADLLNNGLIDQKASATDGTPVTISTLPPDRIETGENETACLNLFLYHIGHNQGWRNVGFPSYSRAGDRVDNPPLALDLYYLLTAYGKNGLDAEILMGYGMQLLHETPVLTRTAIRKSLGPPSPPVDGGILPGAKSKLAAAELAEQVELIKISPHAIGSEEIIKLWTAIQTKYRTSAVYHVSVVLIDSAHSTRSALPVRNRKLHVMPFRRPVIDAVLPQSAKTGDAITIEGQNLKSDSVKVTIGEVSVVPDPSKILEDKIEVTIPATLRAGINAVRMVHELDFGTDKEPHLSFESNVVVFILLPVITSAAPFSAARGSTLTLSFMPPIARDQKVMLLIGDSTITIKPRPFNGPAATTSLDFPIPSDFPAGTFLLRVRVDGAETQLLVDEDPLSPTVNQYIGPKVTIT